MNSENASSESTTSESAGTATSPSSLQNVINHMASNKIGALLWLTRLGTMVFTLLYIMPIGVNSYSCYQKALIANAATSSLRLHQRLPHVRLSREFLAQLLIEDSCHYLFYSIIFLYSYPVTMVLLPIFLFALLHSTSYTQTLVQLLGMGESWLFRTLTTVVENQRNMLRILATVEIMLMPMTIFMMFSGRGSLLVPFVYFRFLTLRYASRRNPYTRTAFHEMRLSVEMLVGRPACPSAIRNLCYKAIGLISRLAPPLPPN